MDIEDPFGFALGLLAIAVFFTWPVLPGLRRFKAFKTFAPFRDWTARPHPDAAVAVEAGRRLDLKPDDTDTAHATVIVRTAWRNQDSREWKPSLRVSRPLVPLVSVDGVPASWGWGITKLTLPPGDHLIAVTSSHSRCYQAVHLGRGERREFDYTSVIGEAAHQYYDAENQIHDRTSFTERRGRPGSTGRFYLIVVSTIVFMTAAMSLMERNPSAFAAHFVNMLVFGALALGLGVGVAVIWSSMAKQARRRRVATADPPTSGDLGQPRILDADEPERIAPASGWAGLALHLRFMLEEHAPETLSALAGGPKLSLIQRWRAVRIGEPEVPECRPWTPAPEVLVDGQPVDASWTRMWLQLAPGEHELTVRVAPPRGQIGPSSRVDLERAEERRRFRVTTGQTAQLTVTAHITAVPRADRPELAEFHAVSR
ncbi:MAG TPA: hypothetical protein VHG10_10770 [Glycomyces sp.]|nr:hypothetical protein [Glycomyces sp.]